MYVIKLNIQVELKLNNALWNELTTWISNFSVTRFMNTCTGKYEIKPTIDALFARVCAIEKNILNVHVPLVKLAPIEVEFTLSEKDIGVLHLIFSYERGPELLTRFVNEVHFKISNASKGINGPTAS